MRDPEAEIAVVLTIRSGALADRVGYNDRSPWCTRALVAFKHALVCIKQDCGSWGEPRKLFSRSGDLCLGAKS